MLSGIRILDLSRILAGPVCTQVLADLGADVIKVERPGSGDDTRQWGPPFLPPAGADEAHGLSAYFLSCNRGKRSLALDLTQPAGRAVLDELIARADVLVENFLPADVERFGLTPERLRRLNPALVSCSISAFGRTGPLAAAPGYDLMIQAGQGLMAITGEPDGRPMKVGVAITDVLTGLYAATSVLAGLLARGRNGAGIAFDLALADCTLASLVNVAQSTLLTGREPMRWGNAHPQIVPYESFATADGHLVLAIGADRQWRKFCTAIGREAWADDPRFATNPARVAERATLIPLLQALLAERTTDQWRKLLTAIDVPHGPVVTADEALRQPQASARGMVRTMTDGQGRSYSVVGNPIHHDGPPPADTRPPPDLGQHTTEILRDWLAYTDAQIVALRSAHAIE